ncbi:MAG: S-layer homology domain-containing protein [Clostridia bacterium]|nr:S-layer homology domain-containing protein [Clostridia bacterium]
MKKRVLSLLLSLAMVFSLLGTTSFAAESFKFKGGEVEATLAVGATIEFPISVEVNPGIVVGKVAAEWDPSAFSLKSVSYSIDEFKNFGSPSISKLPAGASKYAITFGDDLYEDNVTATGEAFVLTFEILAGAVANKEYVIKLTPDAGNMTDVNLDLVSAVAENGSITLIPVPVPATGISLNKNELSLVAGASETLIADVEPDNTTDAVAWSSNEESVATVDANGKVTAVAEGTATITAEAGGKSATCIVTVTCNHDYSGEKVEERYKVSGATCDSPAVYYKSCKHCGEVDPSEKTFTSGSKLTHEADGVWKFDGTNHWQLCKHGCGTKMEEAKHDGGTATCTEQPTCSDCNQKYGSALGHNYGTLITKKDPIHSKTELTDGMAAHYFCDVCDTYFAEDKTETNAAALKIEVAPHNFDTSKYVSGGSKHWYACTICGLEKDGSIASCTDDDHNNICDVCKAAICEHTGTIGAVEAQPAGCTTDGVKAHYKCSACGTLFSDDAGKNTVTTADLRIPAAHTLGEWIAEDPAECGVPGTKGHYVCSVCNENIAADKETVIEDLTIPALEHTGGTATCVAQAVCDLCHQPYGELNPDKHASTLDIKYNDTHHWGYCDACEKTLPEEAHKDGTADCTYQAVCSICEQPYGDINPDAHKWGDDNICDNNEKHTKTVTEVEPGTKVEIEVPEEIKNAVQEIVIEIQKVIEEAIEVIEKTDWNTLFKDGSVEVVEDKLVYELLPDAPEGEYNIEITVDDVVYLVNVVVAEESVIVDRPDRPSYNSSAVKKVIEMIEELPSAKKVTLDDEEDIEAARKAYEKLSKADKAKVTNYEDLVEAEEALEALKKAEEETPVVTTNPFVDVDEDAYYADPVLWAVANNITSGTSAVTFSPDAVCTRAQVVTFLWRAAGCPAPLTTEMPFVDVEAGAYYAAAVQWAVENNITAGTSATTFDPNGKCTRGQIVTFLWRAQGNPAAAAVNNFVDVEDGAYYNAPVLWAVANGITNGTSTTTFSPAADCTRAQVVTFIYRCMAE